MTGSTVQLLPQYYVQYNFSHSITCSTTSPTVLRAVQLLPQYYVQYNFSHSITCSTTSPTVLRAVQLLPQYYVQYNFSHSITCSTTSPTVLRAVQLLPQYYVQYNFSHSVKAVQGRRLDGKRLCSHEKVNKPCKLPFTCIGIGVSTCSWCLCLAVSDRIFMFGKSEDGKGCGYALADLTRYSS